jgi:hypothetical protein
MRAEAAGVPPPARHRIDRRGGGPAIDHRLKPRWSPAPLNSCRSAAIERRCA